MSGTITNTALGSMNNDSDSDKNMNNSNNNREGDDDDDDVKGGRDFLSSEEAADPQFVYMRLLQKTTDLLGKHGYPLACVISIKTIITTMTTTTKNTIAAGILSTTASSSPFSSGAISTMYQRIMIRALKASVMATASAEGSKTKRSTLL